jgi:hypothetical protein
VKGVVDMKKLRTRNLLVQVVGNVLITVNAEASPTDEEWEQKLELYREVPDLKRMRILVFTLGGAPNSKQRARLNHVIADHHIPQAVLTNSTLARAAGTAISWFQPTFKMFAPDQLEPALDHLKLPQDERPVVRGALREMREEVYGPARSATL